MYFDYKKLKGNPVKPENKETEKKPLPMNETIYIREGYILSLFETGKELKVFNEIDNALGAENEVVRVGVYKLDRIICVKKTVSTVQVSCEGAK